MKVLRLYKIMKDNHIMITDLAKKLNIPYPYLSVQLKLIKDFKIDELIYIKNYLVNKGVLKDDYDYCNLLDLVDYDDANDKRR